MLLTLFEAVIVFLAAIFFLFGTHRLWTVMRWRRHSSELEIPRESGLPSVTVQLPVFNERTVIERLIRATAVIDYPSEKLEIQVLDDSTDETSEIAAAVASELSAGGIRVVHLRRPDRTAFKAGALAYGLDRARGELIAIFDADFIPPRDFLRQTVGHFVESTVGMVQARWSFTNETESWFTRAQSLSLRGHFCIEHFARSRSGAFFNFNGTAGIWRASAIRDAGGWKGDTLTEDLDLSYRAQMKGWRFIYCDDLHSESELPPEMRAYKTQQFRWMKGMAQVARKLLPGLLRSNLPVHVKMEAVCHLLASSMYAMALASFLCLLPLMLVTSLAPWVLGLYGASLCFSTASVAVFFACAEHASGRKPGLKFLGELLSLFVLGIGQSFTATHAFLEGIRGTATAFERTPKRGSAGRPYSSGLRRHFAGDLALAVYAVVTLVTAATANRLMLPWAALFFVGTTSVLVEQLWTTAPLRR